MALHFIFGPARSGKTTHTFDKIIGQADGKRDERFLFVVPEQSTLNYEQGLILRKPDHILTNIDVLSLTRLALKVEEEKSLPHKEELDELGRNMLVRTALLNVKDGLSVFKTSIDKPGFVQKIAATMTELNQYNVSAQALENITGGLADKPQLLNKLHEIILIKQEYDRLLGDRFITRDQKLNILLDHIGTTDFLAHSTIILDNFYTLTTLQYNIVCELMARCVDVYVILDMTESEYRQGKKENSLFAPSWEIIGALSEFAGKTNVKVAEPEFIDGSEHEQSADLKFLRDNFDSTLGKEQRMDLAEHIYSALAEDPEDEVEKLCAEIMYLVREQGYRFKNIGVITTDLGTYGDIIERKFSEADIPYFMDNRHNLGSTTPIRIIEAAVKVVSDSFDFDSVIGYLRSGVEDDMSTIDKIENYAREYGIKTKKKFTARWIRSKSLTDGQLTELNDEKDGFLEPLLELSDAFKKSKVSDKVDALREFGKTLNFDEICKERAEFLKANGLGDMAEEYEQVLEQMDRVYDQVISLMGDQVVDNKLFTDILTEGLESLKVGVIPPSMDNLIVGDLVRSRIARVDALFVIGMNDGSFPAVLSQDEIFNDSDREKLEQLNVKLADTSKKENLENKSILYRTFTKPEKRLYMSYSAQSLNGSNLRESYVLENISSLFKSLSSWDETEFIYAERQGLQCLADGRVSDEATIKGLKEYFKSKDNCRELLKMIDHGVYMGCRTEKLEDDHATELYVLDGKTSVTQLEKHASCQMKHFLECGLKLHTRREYRIMKMDMGNIYHRALELIVSNIKANNIDYAAITDADRADYIDKYFNRAIEEAGTDVFADDPRNAYFKTRMEEILKINLDAIIRHIVGGSFRPAAVELEFGKNKIPAMEIPGSNVKLQGKIDRLDTADDAIRIVDYKTGNKKFDFTELYYGLTIQTQLYLSEAMKMYPKASPTGGFYYKLADPVIELSGNNISDMAGMDEAQKAEYIYEKRIEQLKMTGPVIDTDVLKMDNLLKNGVTSKILSGLALTSKGEFSKKNPVNVSAEDMNELCNIALENAKSGIDTILSGDIKIDPYNLAGRKPCTYCEFKDVCGFDENIPGCGYRDLKKVEMFEYLSEKAKERKDKDGSGVD